MLQHPQLKNASFARVGTDEYLTYYPTEYQWTKGDARFRIIFDAGLNLDFMSSPAAARPLGFAKEDPRTWEASKLHDFICYYITHHGGELPQGSYQFQHPVTQAWHNCHSTRWTFKEADALFKKKLIEDGYPPNKAHVAYLSLRMFGWLYRLLKK